MASSDTGSRIEELNLFYEEARRNHSRPLWLSEGNEPPPSAVPFLWRWSDFRPLMYRAAELVDMDQAERRVLVLANPGLAGRPAATNTLVANLQIINPGDVARSHRHTASALRLVLEGTGAYTAVNGEKTYMDPGDFVTTPNWTWHDHCNEGDRPMVWLDGLDVPLVNYLGAMKQEQDVGRQQAYTKSDDVSMRLYGGANLTPTWVQHNGPHSPLLNYKFEQTYATLAKLASESEGSPFDGVCVEYTNPRTGGPAMASMACFAQLLQPGQHTLAHRHTGNVVYHVVQGKGHSIIDGTRFDWTDKDTFVVPSRAHHEHAAELESVLFSYTDAPVLRPFDLYWEEEYGENGGRQEVREVFVAGPGA